MNTSHRPENTISSRWRKRIWRSRWRRNPKLRWMIGGRRRVRKISPWMTLLLTRARKRKMGMMMIFFERLQPLTHLSYLSHIKSYHKILMKYFYDPTFLANPNITNTIFLPISFYLSSSKVLSPLSQNKKYNNIVQQSATASFAR